MNLLKQKVDLYRVPLRDDRGNYIGDAYVDQHVLDKLSVDDSINLSCGTVADGKFDANQLELPLEEVQ